MSLDEKYGRYCDECGRTIKKAHRIFEGKDYCSSCYPRVFIKVICSKCGQLARVHKLSQEPALCRACRSADRVCVRCGKKVSKAGLISEGKVVCPSCAPYFRKPEPCQQCGVFSSRLSRMPSAGIYEKLCISCRNKVTHKTCSICRKYRKVSGFLNDGKPYCSACSPGAEITHACPSCGVTLPGSGLSRCIACLNLSRISQETRLTGAVFRHSWTQNLYSQFALWIHKKQPNSPNTLKLISSHSIFFERLDVSFSSVTEITAHTFLDAFGTTTSRKHLLATQFCNEVLSLKLTQEMKNEYAERERIRAKVQDSKMATWGYLLEDYHASLVQQKLTFRTIRLYLSSAESFCSFAKLSKTAWTEDRIRIFLKNHPGLRANLYKFVSFCKQAYGWNVEIPKRSELGVKPKLPKTVLELKLLLKQASMDGVENTSKQVLAKIIAKSLGLPTKTIEGVTLAQITNSSEGLVLHLSNQRVLIPSKLDAIAEAYFLASSGYSKLT